MIYLFDSFELDEENFCLTREGQRVALEPKCLRVLLLLAQSGGRLLEKNAIIEAVWKDTFVEETTLTRAIALLRKQLGDDPRKPGFIETVPTLGYRFIAKVEMRQRGDGAAEPAEAIAQGQAMAAAPSGVHSEAPPPSTPKGALHERTPQRKVYYYAAAVVVLFAALGGAFLLIHSPTAKPLASQEWEQLTFFTDSAVYPALSPDGHMLAFIRGSNSFMGRGQVYVKLLPSGEPVQLTNDDTVKLAPWFSPDGSNIAYSIIDPFDTWEVSALGGNPHLLLPNSSSLTWIEQGKRLLFSEIREGLHLVVVTTDESRGNSRDVYVPPGKRSMAHHSYLSPDGRWVLVVEMDSQGKIVPCRVVPFQGGNVVRLVGPPNGTCLSGAWSPDGKWIYLTSTAYAGPLAPSGMRATTGSHIWRQRFPNGKPEQLTFGPTSQEGIALAADGKSLITSVGSEDRTVWLHDKDGDHQISSEGNASSPSFSSDGRNLYFLMSNGQTQGEELWIKDLPGGKVERVLPGYPMQSYSVSRDGKQVAFTMNDQSGPANIWVASASRLTPPLRIPSSVAEDSPYFLPDGDLVFRATEGGSNYLYRMKTDGSARKKISPERILDAYGVSPDGRWIAVATPESGDEPQNTGETEAFAADGSAAVAVCTGFCVLHWDTSGGFVYLSFPNLSETNLALPVMRGSGLPEVPPVIAPGSEHIANSKETKTTLWQVGSAVNPSLYAYTRENIRRNLYRIQLPSAP